MFCGGDKKNKSSEKLPLKIKFECKKSACSEASSSEDEDAGKRKSRRKGCFYHTNTESNEKSSEEKEIKLPKCGRKGHIRNLNE